MPNYLTDIEREEKRSLLDRRGNLVLEKKSHEAALAAIKNQMRSRTLPIKQYQQCLDGQNKRMRQIQYVEAEITTIKSRLREIDDAETVRFNLVRDEEKAACIKLSESATETHDSRFVQFLLSVSSLRDEYRRFSADASRVSSMRRCAAEFSNKLDDAIKNAQTGGPKGLTEPDR